jgi:hypothetical protein
MSRDGCGGELEHFGNLPHAELIVFQQRANHPHPIAVSQGFGDFQCFFHVSPFRLYNSLIDEMQYIGIYVLVNMYFDIHLDRGHDPFREAISSVLLTMDRDVTRGLSLVPTIPS